MTTVEQARAECQRHTIALTRALEAQPIDWKRLERHLQALCRALGKLALSVVDAERDVLKN